LLEEENHDWDVLIQHTLQNN